MSADIVARMEPLADLEQAGALTRTGLKLPGTITYEQYEALGRALGEAHESLQWAIGDWLVDGETLFPDEHSQAALSLGLSEESCKKMSQVAERIPREARRAELTYSHHRAVAWVRDERRRDELLELAVQHGWTTRELEVERKNAPIGELPGPSLDWRYSNLKQAALRLVTAKEMMANGTMFAVPVVVMEELAAAIDVQ